MIRTTHFLCPLACIFIAQLYLSSSCNKYPRTCGDGAYSFAVSSEWTLQKETYSINDTIFLSSAFSKTLTDLTGNYSVDYSNGLPVAGDFTMFELDSNSHQVNGAVSKFEIVALMGTTSPNPLLPNEKLNYMYAELPGIYSFKMGIAPKQKGIYAVYISNLASSGIIGKSCSNAGFSNKLNNTNRNLSLFQFAMNRPPVSQFEIDHIYCFRVK